MEVKKLDKNEYHFLLHKKHGIDYLIYLRDAKELGLMKIYSITRKYIKKMKEINCTWTIKEWIEHLEKMHKENN